MIALNLKGQADLILSLDKIDLIGSDRRLIAALIWKTNGNGRNEF